jgi:excinuclease ABC subunit C
MSAFEHKKVVADIPHKPGVYQFWDTETVLVLILTRTTK